MANRCMEQNTDQQQQAPVDGEKTRRYGETIMARIRASEKRENNWRKQAGAAEKAYMADPDSGSDGRVYDFNILHSNVETIVPAIYNSTPAPDIRPRRVESSGPIPRQPEMPPQQEGQQPDPQQMAQMQQAMQQFQQAMQVYQTKKQADKDAKEYATMLERSIAVQIDDSRLDKEVEAEAQDSFSAGRGILRIRFDGEYGKDERIAFEAVSWRDYREGPAKRWEDVPWVAFCTIISRETYDRMSDEALVASQIKDGEMAPLVGDEDEDDLIIWEVWDKVEGKVCWVREDNSMVIREEPDPLGLPGFFPMPEPIQPIGVAGKRTPVCPFAVYQKLADELDMITKRINKIMKGLKVRGVVAGNASTLAQLADADDNEIKIEPDLEQLMQTGGLEKAVLWWPVEQGIKVLQQLYIQRDQVKASIYEITGISDIVRGASNANETATAQNIKTKWGSLRIQRMQRMIERQVRDVFVIMAHLITTKFSPETIQRMTGIEMTPGIMALMQNPVDADYRINVESDSTVMADLTDRKREMGEFLAASGQFFNTVAPIVATQPEAAEPLAEIYAATSRLFRLGKQAEDALERFTDLAKQTGAQKQKPKPEEQKIAMEMEQAKHKADLENKKLEVDIKVAQADAALKNKELELKKLEVDLKADEVAMNKADKLATHFINIEKMEREENETEDAKQGMN
jgi:hypothetical protein